MRGFKFNFITILAFVLLVVYAYLAAMGLLYQKGDILIAGAFFVGIVALVSICIYLMCRARATRWQEKIGIPAQIVLGIVIVATFFYIGKPFSSYVTMMGQKNKVYHDIQDVVKTAKDLNNAYSEYAIKRIHSYQPNESTAERQQIRKNALRLYLMPPQLSVKQPDRDAWLDEISNMKLHNIQMPNNLAQMDSCVHLWMQDYAMLSSVVYEDEVDVQPFVYDTFATQYGNLKSHLGGYSIWALLVAIICSIFMLIPYFTTVPDLSLREGDNEGLFAKLKRKLVASDNQLYKSGRPQDNDVDYL